ncbi:MAG: hypothetical protein QOD83_202 [Solirubrobacteraceae bacterium]|jgi:hypothetical protein|nr:hypothetical protein [Solirubrobacteraceae bacterium]
MTDRHFAALLGFAFVAVWIAMNLGYALLCLIGAAAFYAIAAVLDGNIDLGELQDRVTQRPPSRTPTPRTAAVRRTPAR